MSSRRLPGKVLEEVGGRPLLAYLLERLEHSRGSLTIVVATSLDPTDDPIASYCKEYGIRCFRGSLEDVAGRFVDLIKEYSFDAFVRISGDSPLLDQELVDKGIGLFLEGGHDLVSNVLVRTFPKGQSVEVIDAKVFIDAYPHMETRSEKEHVTPFFYKRSDKYRIRLFKSGRDYSSLQLSVDTREDMNRFRSILMSMKRPHWTYGMEDIISLNSAFADGFETQNQGGFP